MEPLLRLMGHVYLPQVAHSGSWPDAVKKDFLSYTHRFMSSLTEAVHEAQGRTVLYMPAEELSDVSTHEAARDRHLTQRLETTLMYWTRQIANVLNKQDCSDMGQRAGPLVEIEFWRSRSADLNGISAQLEDKAVRRVAITLQCGAPSCLVSGHLQLQAYVILGPSHVCYDNLHGKQLSLPRPHAVDTWQLQQRIFMS
jgi:dynein heavy chain